jgi:hypothetical protein
MQQPQISGGHHLMKGFQQVNILCNQRLMRSGKQPHTFANRDRRQRRPQDADFGIAPSEEWRLMSAVRREINPNIRRWGLGWVRRGRPQAAVCGITISPLKSTLIKNTWHNISSRRTYYLLPEKISVILGNNLRQTA